MKPSRGGDRVDDLVRHRRVGRHGHHRDVAAAAVLARATGGRRRRRRCSRLPRRRSCRRGRSCPAGRRSGRAPGASSSSWRLKRSPQASSRCGRCWWPSVVPTTRSRSPPASSVMRTRSVKSRAEVCVRSETSMPRSSASAGALTRLTSSSVWPASRPLSTERVSRRVSRSAMRPEVLDLHALDARGLRERHPEPPEAAGQRQERAEHLHVLRGDGGDVDRGGDDAAGQRRHDLLGGLDARRGPAPRGSRRRGAG